MKPEEKSIPEQESPNGFKLQNPPEKKFETETSFDIKCLIAFATFAGCVHSIASGQLFVNIAKMIATAVSKAYKKVRNLFVKDKGKDRVDIER